MRKLRLDVETLVVESFEAGVGRGVGTVRAHDDTFEVIDDTMNCQNTEFSCSDCATDCYDGTCTTGGGPTALVQNSCAGLTCGFSCAPGCRPTSAQVWECTAAVFTNCCIN